MKTLRFGMACCAVMLVVIVGHAEAQQPTVQVPVRTVDEVRRTGISVARVMTQRQPAVLAQNIRLTFHLIEANGFQTVDPAIADVVQELRGLFRFEGYRLLGTSLLTGVLDEQASMVRQRIAVEEMNPLELRAAIMRSANAETARIEVELSDVYSSYGLMSVSVNVRDGQTVVLGSGRPDGARGTLILVMSADIEPYD